MYVNILNKQSDNYPKSWLDMAYTPEVYILGGDKLPTKRVVTFVGTRRPTPYGRTVTEQLIYGLADFNVTILSGLAIGIDALSHQAALKNKLKTVAVVPNSVKDIFPRSNIHLAKQIINSGGQVVSLVSETKPLFNSAYHKRNQLIAAMSDVIVVVEAALKSGTMITTRHGLEMGKTVLAVPGRINDVMSAGCNLLISQGAIPVLSSEDIIIALGLTPEDRNLNLDKTEELIIKQIGLGTEIIDDIAVNMQLNTTELTAKLTDLEIRGIINIEAGRVFLKGVA